MKLKKPTFKHIESELYSYHDTLREIQFLRTNLMFCKENDDENIGGGRSSYISSPTEQIGTKLATHKRLLRLEEITNTIKTVYDGLPDTHQQLIRLKYWTKPQLKTWEGIAQEMKVSRMTAFRYRDEIIVVLAEMLGLR